MTATTLLAPRAAAPRAEARRWWGLIAALTGVFMPILDFFIVNVAVPSIQSGLGASSGQTELVVAGYAVAYAALVVTGGRLGDRLGRRRAFELGMVGFTVASLLCAIAPDAITLVAARGVQGIAAALLFPQVLALVQALFAPHERARAMTYYGLAIGLAAALGALVGGALISADLFGWSWRWCFLINVPVGLLALAAVRTLIPSLAPGAVGRLDVVGSVLLFTGLVLLILPLTEGRALGWPIWSCPALVGAVATLALFARHQLRLHRAERAPLLPAPLFAQRGFVPGLLSVFAFYAGLSSFFFILALQLQQGQGLSPVDSGLEVTSLAIGFFVSSLLGRGLAERYGSRPLTAGTFVLLAAYAGAFLVTAADPRLVDRTLLAVVLAVAGFGQGLVLTPLLGRALAAVEPAYTGAASGTLAAVQQVGGAIGVALVGMVFFHSAGATGVSRAVADSRGFQAGLVYLAFTVFATLAGLRALSRDRSA